MIRMPAPSAGQQPRPVKKLNLVPSRATRQLAERMIYDAQQTTGADVVLAHIRSINPTQVPALIGILLTATKPHRKLGRPIVPLTLSPDERREAHRLYKQGDRTEWVVLGQREYQRANTRSLRARGVSY